MWPLIFQFSQLVLTLSIIICKFESVILRSVTKAEAYLKDIEMVCKMILRFNIEVVKIHQMLEALEHPSGPYRFVGNKRTRRMLRAILWLILNFRFEHLIFQFPPYFSIHCREWLFSLMSMFCSLSFARKEWNNGNVRETFVSTLTSIFSYVFQRRLSANKTK